MRFDLPLQEVLGAAKKIQGIVRRTPLVESPRLASSGDAERVLLKLESLQNTGAFKVRGAANRILNLSAEEQRRGIITFSTGNHGKAVAFVAGRTGIPAVVCVSEHVPAYRAAAIRDLGAEVVVKGRSQDDAEAEYRRIMAERRLVPVVPFDDPFIIAGQGTVALEMLSDAPDLDTIVVPLSGGGLLAGIALTAKIINPAIRVVGVSITRSPAMLESLKAARPVVVAEQDTLADSLLGGIGAENHYTMPVIRDLVDEHILVDEPEIAAAMHFALARHSLVIEGAAAVGIAALRTGRLSVPGKRVGIVVSGSSVDLPRYLDTMREVSRRAAEE